MIGWISNSLLALSKCDYRLVYLVAVKWSVRAERPSNLQWKRKLKEIYLFSLSVIVFFLCYLLVCQFISRPKVGDMILQLWPPYRRCIFITSNMTLLIHIHWLTPPSWHLYPLLLHSCSQRTLFSVLTVSIFLLKNYP